MATEKDKKASPEDDAADVDGTSAAGGAALSAGQESDSEEVEFDGGAPAQLGTERYVHAAFFAAGVLIAFLVGKILAAIWNSLAEWPAATRALPFLLRYAEDERPTFTMMVGAVVAIAAVVYAVRKKEVRQWADEVATELYKVHWPDREVVTNGTIVVLVAGVFATVYIGLLDRVWNFITNLVYGI